MQEAVFVTSQIECTKIAIDWKDCTILIVESDRKARECILDYLESTYNVLWAENWYSALEIIRKNKVDLVIGNVFIPDLDGLVFCRMLKNNVETNHIDIVIITAQDSIDNQIVYYNSGVDTYIVGPVAPRVLDACVRNILRKRIRRINVKDVQREEQLNKSLSKYISVEDELLKQTVECVGQNLSNIDLDVDKLAAQMNVSHSTLYRRIKKLTGLTIGELIRYIRLHQGAKLLLCSPDKIADIAYSVGFRDPKYFSRLFKALFGESPVEYRGRIIK